MDHRRARRDLSPNKTQRLLNHAVWDQDAVMGIVRGFVAQHLGGQSLRVVWSL